jgi:shikimate kinase
MYEVYARTVESTDAPPKPMRVILIGMMGSGKSSVGRALSAQTGWPFHDNDALVERATGRTAREVLATEGEAGLRAAEAAALDAALEAAAPAIVALAAGTVLDPDQRQRTADAGFVVWLHAAPEILAGRSVGGAHRPWLEGNPAEWFRRAAAERDWMYASIDDLEIDTAGTDADAAAERILSAIGER